MLRGLSPTQRPNTYTSRRRRATPRRPDTHRAHPRTVARSAPQGQTRTPRTAGDSFDRRAPTRTRTPCRHPDRESTGAAPRTAGDRVRARATLRRRRRTRAHAFWSPAECVGVKPAIGQLFDSILVRRDRREPAADMDDGRHDRGRVVRRRRRHTRRERSRPRLSIRQPHRVAAGVSST